METISSHKAMNEIGEDRRDYFVLKLRRASVEGDR
jgi:hypothetical protein